MVTVVAVLAAVGFCVWYTRHVDQRATTDREQMVEALQSGQMTAMECVRQTAQATAEAVSSAVSAALGPPPTSASQPGGKSYSEHEIARELYEQGVVPTFNDPTDASDPTDGAGWLQVKREDVATASPNDREPFGVPGVAFQGPNYDTTYTNVVPFPPPSPRKDA